MAKLTHEQRRAMEDVAALLERIAKAADRVDAARTRDAAPALTYASPHNQVILIDGGRGAGKTTLMLTLLDQLQRPPAARELPKLVTHHYRPLKLLDLNPMHDGLSILAHIAMHLAPSPRPAQAPWRGESALHPWREAWRQFASQVHVAQGEGGTGRAGRDMEMVMHEMERAAASWSTLTRSFYELVDARIEAEREDKQPAPLLVLPIDDADLQVERGIELLTALRTLSHPRLVFLLNGDSRLFDSLLRLAMFARLKRAQGGATATASEEVTQALQEQSNQLAYEFFERVLPPDHRCAIAHLAPEQRLPRLSLSSDLPQPQGTPLEILRELPIGHEGTPPLTVASLLEGSPLLGHALPDRLRALINLDRELRKDRGRLADASRPALHAARRLWRDAVRREPLNTAAQRALIDLITITPEGMLEFRGSHVEITYVYAERTLNGSAHFRSVLRQPRSFRGRLRYLDGNATSYSLSSSLVAALQVVHDVAQLTGSLSPFDRDAIVQHNFPALASTLARNGAAPLLEVRWPLPPVRTFYGLYAWIDATFVLLNQVPSATSRTTRPTTDEGMRALLSAYLWILPAVHRGMQPTPGGSATLRPWSEILKALAEAVQQSIQSSGTTDSARMSEMENQIRDHVPFGAWVLDELILLAAPEYGLANDCASEFLREFQSSFSIRLAGETSVAHYIRAGARAARDEALLRSIRQQAQQPAEEGRLALPSLEEVRKRIDDRADSTHPWLLPSYGPLGENVARTVDTVLAELGEQPLPEPVPPLAPPMPSLASYIERIQARRRLLQGGLEDLRPVLEELRKQLSNLESASASEIDPEAMVAMLWQKIESSPYITAPKPNRLKIVLQTRTTLETLWQASQPSGPVVDFVGSEVMLTTPLTLAADMTPLTSAADLTCRVVLDLIHDGQLRLHRPQPSSTYGYPGAYVLLNGQRFPWPSFPFTAPFDLELFNENWDEIVQIARLETAHQPDDPQNTTIDLLAQQYIRLTREVVCSRLASQQLLPRRPSRKSTLNNWDAALHSLFTEPKTHGRIPLRLRFEGPRRSQFIAWRSSVFVMAAPEYGLSYNASEFILNVLRSGLPEEAQLPSPQQVVEKRNQLWNSWISQLFNNLDQKSQLSALPINALRSKYSDTRTSFPDHPWTKFEHELTKK